MKRVRNIVCLFALALCLPWAQVWAQEPDESVVLRMEMKRLILDGKDVTAIDVRGTALEELNLSGNSLDTIDVSGCGNLLYLDCRANGLNTLELGGSIISLSAENNSMSLSTVYALLAAHPKDAAYHFNPQRIEKSLKAGEVLDLRSEFTIADCPSDYILYDESTGEVAAAQNYTLANGMLTMRHSGSYRLELSNRAVTDYTENGGVGDPDTCIYLLQVEASGEQHTVSVRSEDVLKGTVSGGGTYEDGDYATITATANDGYVFDRWESNGVYFSGERNLGFSVYSDYDLTAYFISTGVGNEEGVSDLDGLRVYAKDKVIYLSEEVEEVRVFTIAGQLVYAGRSTAVPVAAPGVYVVRVGAVCHKVMVF